MASIRVGNIPADVRRHSVFVMCRSFGMVLSYTYHYDPNNGKRTGFVTCAYYSRAAAEYACQGLHNLAIKGHLLQCVLLEEDIKKTQRFEEKAEEEEDEGDSDEPPMKKQRVDNVLAQVQQLTLDELASVSPAVRAQLQALAEVLKLGDKHCRKERSRAVNAPARDKEERKFAESVALKRKWEEASKNWQKLTMAEEPRNRQRTDEDPMQARKDDNADNV
jgi:hypothetical protein